MEKYRFSGFLGVSPAAVPLACPRLITASPQQETVGFKRKRENLVVFQAAGIVPHACLPADWHWGTETPEWSLDPVRTGKDGKAVCFSCQRVGH